MARIVTAYLPKSNSSCKIVSGRNGSCSTCELESIPNVENKIGSNKNENHENCDDYWTCCQRQEEWRLKTDDHLG